jgi:hypothetical protein
MSDLPFNYGLGSFMTSNQGCTSCSNSYSVNSNPAVIGLVAMPNNDKTMWLQSQKMHSVPFKGMNPQRLQTKNEAVGVL